MISTDDHAYYLELHGLRELSECNEELLQFGNWNWSPSTNELRWTKGMYMLMDLDLTVPLMEITPSLYLHYIMSEGWRKAFESFHESQLVEGGPIEYECSVTTANHQEKVLFSKGKVSYDALGNVIITGITRDITNIKKTEYQLRQKVSEIEQLNQELTNFISVASHDLQEPLRKIATLSDRLQDKFYNKLPEVGKNYLDRIQLVTKDARLLVDSLIELSCIASQPKVAKDVDLNVLIREVESDLALTIEENCVNFISDKLQNLEVSPLQIKKLFSNIFLNAIKFRKTDVAPIITIRGRYLEKFEVENIQLDSEMPHYLMTVEDNGIGFEDTYASEIFQIFSRLHGKSEYAGPGIGLSLCKKIIKNHKGHISAKSAPGGGTTFSIVLPQKKK